MAKKEAGASTQNANCIVKVVLHSLSPVLFDRMDPQTLIDMADGVKKGKDTETSILDKAAKKLYREYDETGEIGFPAENFFACFVEAGRHVFYDTKAKISTKDSSLLPAMLSIEEDFIPFEITTPKEIVNKTKKEWVGKEGWVVDIRKAVLDNGGKKVACPAIRPKIHSWTAELTLHLNLQGHPVDEDKIKDLIAKAGNMIGIAAYRPSCRGTFGRFQIESWKAKAVAKAA
ncbi:MAG: hypothetical protein NTX00_02760 [Candidatus Parcubacteria bacterium]|nr:hypothetical protein [Candidatus Parcubacteria bacterium]